ncbi:MAG: hypothetical protein LDL50_02690 [Chloroflexi bacterium]|nr:hypothetical protein [Chloroflexota bacterium]
MTYSHPDFKEEWDHVFYIEMALGHPANMRLAPFEYRVLNPFLAKSLPFDVLTNFALLSFTALWLTGMVSYFAFKAQGFSVSLAFAGVLFFLSLGWAVRFNLYDFWLSDPLGFLFMVAVVWSVVTRKDILFLFLLAAGVAAKENVVFAAPLYYTLNAKKFADGRLLLRALLLTAPALALLLALRMFVPTVNEEYNFATLLQNIGLKRIQQILRDPRDYLLLYSIGTFGVSLFFLPFFAVRKTLALLVRYSPLIAGAYLSLLFAHNDTRLIVAAFPAVIVMALRGLEFIVERTGAPERFVVALPLTLILLLLFKKEWYAIPSVYEAAAFVLFLAFLMQSGRSAKVDYSIP